MSKDIACRLEHRSKSTLTKRCEANHMPLSKSRHRRFGITILVANGGSLRSQVYTEEHRREGRKWFSIEYPKAGRVGRTTSHVDAAVIRGAFTNQPMTAAHGVAVQRNRSVWNARKAAATVPDFARCGRLSMVHTNASSVESDSSGRVENGSFVLNVSAVVRTAAHTVAAAPIAQTVSDTGV